MQKTVTLHASARFGFGGKQYIARITGRDPKFTFARDFVGQKSGKRREDAEYMTDEPGLYMTCDIDRKGNKDETYWVVERQDDGGLIYDSVCKEDAMALAKAMETMEFPAACVEVFGKNSAYWTAPPAQEESQPIMTVAEVLADPQAFVNGMTETTAVVTAPTQTVIEVEAVATLLKSLGASEVEINSCADSVLAAARKILADQRAGAF